MGTISLTPQQMNFRDSIGQKATVNREQVDAETAAQPNRLLVNLGLAIQQEPKHRLETYRYLGSAAVHIYAHDLLGQLDIVSQANPLVLYRCPEDLASKAMEDLIREMKAAYGRRHTKLRSGF